MLAGSHIPGVHATDDRDNEYWQAAVLWWGHTCSLFAASLIVTTICNVYFRDGSSRTVFRAAPVTDQNDITQIQYTDTGPAGPNWPIYARRLAGQGQEQQFLGHWCYSAMKDIHSKRTLYHCAGFKRALFIWYKTMLFRVVVCFTLYKKRKASN